MHTRTAAAVDHVQQGTENTPINSVLMLVPPYKTFEMTNLAFFLFFCCVPIFVGQIVFVKLSINNRIVVFFSQIPYYE